ncbi:MAG: hypothetical protein JO250_11190 [Armatimonadetes bacterium]|nr:hypothetical protein [Armatimonadota bacterium]
MTVLSANNLVLDAPELRDAVTLLVALQHAICNENEDEADHLREELDRPLRRLTWEQNEWLRGLSGDLEMLCDTEIFEPNRLPRQEYVGRLTQAWRDVEQDPNVLLRLLRKEQDFLSADRVAIARARCYHLLGFQDLFREFMLEAIRRDPERPLLKALLLVELAEQGTFDDAWQLAQEILSDPRTEPGMIFVAAGRIHSIAGTLNEERARLVLGRLRQEVQKVFDNSPPEDLPLNEAVLGLTVMASINEGLRRTSAAREYYLRALQLDPDASDVLMALGLLLFRANADAALPYFEEAVRLGTSIPWPYIVLARKALGQERYGDAETLSRQVLNLSDLPRVQAYGYEFLAISQGGVNGLTDEVIANLEKAASLFPENISLRQNYQEALRLRAEDQAGTPQDGVRVPPRRPGFLQTLTSRINQAEEIVPSSSPLLMRMGAVFQASSHEIDTSLALAA